MNPITPEEISHFLQSAESAIRDNDFRRALAALDNVLENNPGHETALLYSAQCRHALGNYSESEKLFQSLLGKYTGVAFYHHSLALLYNDWQKPEMAMVQARHAVALMPGAAEAWAQLSLAYRSIGDGKNALDAAEHAVKLSPTSDALKHRAYANLMLHRADEASRDFADSMRTAFGGSSAPWRPEFINTTPAKLCHDIEQYAYLHQLTGNPAFLNLSNSHRQFLGRLPPDIPRDQIITLTPAAMAELGHAYNRLHYFSEASRVAGSAINTERDFKQIEQDYHGRSPGITWIDDFLRPETLQALRRYCLENTFWFDFRHPNGYLGALMENGFAAPLLFQIAEDLRRHLPEIFLDYPLFQMWAFKYDSSLQGIQMHADVAAVNLNFWITPNEANLAPESGGLVIWNKEAPQDWQFQDYNSGSGDRQSRITEFLKSSGAERITVPYRQNRAVLFNSDLFHSTDEIRFQEGYENRRINITLLFGRRQTIAN